MEEQEPAKRCWMCKRSEEECLRDFKNIILESDEESEMFGPVVPQNIKDLVKKDGIFPYPTGSEWKPSKIMHFEKGWDINTGKDIKFETERNMFVNIYLCNVCQSLLDDNWESLKNFMFDRLKEKGIDLSV